MIQPQIKQADSIDDQKQNASSLSQDLSGQAHPVPLNARSQAPSEPEILCRMTLESAEESQKTTPIIKSVHREDRQSLETIENEYLEIALETYNIGEAIHDNFIETRNESHASEEDNIADVETEDGMDDELMDKISSSPSIEDGGYILPPRLWPQRSTFAHSAKGALSPSQACCESSFLFKGSPDDSFFRILSDPSDKDAGQSLQEQENNFHRMSESLGSIQQNSRNERYFHVPGAFIESPDIPDQVFQIHNPAEESLDGKTNFLMNENPQTLVKFHSEFPCNNAKAIINYENQSNALSETRFSILVPYAQEEHKTIPYESSEDEDDEIRIRYNTDSKFVDSGWGGEGLQELEDINFEFVYALHTFIATIEGQANVTKGDTMVLLDDSNSYWWLVRVVKDSSIGYLPAEHIETPTERLARLNKHRNIDTERPKNSLKIAFRKKSTKTVAFSDPTYVEASDIDFSSEDEDENQVYHGLMANHELAYEHQESMDDEDETEVIEPLRTRSEIRRIVTETEEQDSPLTENESGQAINGDELLNGSKSRHGVLRNTDSFFQDDTVETRKITLTPNLLRDDSSPPAARISYDSKELSRSSLDRLEKDLPDRGEDKRDRKEKKEKDKKSSMLSGLFKRKDRKNRSVDEDIDEISGIKQSNEFSRGSPVLSNKSDDVVQVKDKLALQAPGLQKQPNQTENHAGSNSPPRKTPTPVREKLNPNLESATAVENSPVVAPTQMLRQVQPNNSVEEPTGQINSVSLSSAAPMNSKEKRSGSVISKVLRSGRSAGSSPAKLRKARSNLNLEDSDPKVNLPLETSSPMSVTGSQLQASPIPTDVVEHSKPDQSNWVERLSESPVQVSSVDESSVNPPALVVDNSSQDGPISSASSASTELIEPGDTLTKIVSGGSTTTSSTMRWNDAHLKTFFDDNADIRDLLIVVYDKSGVVPAGPEHPIVGKLFKEENARLADMRNRLDCLLGDWLARKLRRHGEI